MEKNILKLISDLYAQIETLQVRNEELERQANDNG